MADIKRLTMEELEGGLEEIRQSPKEEGVLEMIVRRPGIDEREELKEGKLELKEGLVGDNWSTRSSSRTVDGSAHPEMQLTIMNSRVIALIAQDKERWQLAGDQLFIDLDISVETLQPGSRLAIGTGMIEITAEPHTGCRKFVERYGIDAMKFVSSALGRQHRLRGVNAKVIQAGTIRVGDTVKKMKA